MAFPNSTATGFKYKFYDELPRNFGAVTDTWEYEDAGKDFNTRTSTPPREWVIEYGPLTKTQCDQFDTFWEANGIHTTFDFVDKYAVTWTGVRIKSYTRSHEAHKSWRKFVRFELIKYP